MIWTYHFLHLTITRLNGINYGKFCSDKSVCSTSFCSLNQYYKGICFILCNRDNRDLDVYVNWEPEFANQSVGKCKEVQRLFSQDVDFLMLRCHIVCALSQAIDVSFFSINLKYILNG